jgi:hypothetical protein
MSSAIHDHQAPVLRCIPMRWLIVPIFLNARYVHARYTSMPAGPVALDELMLYGGLGWQFRTRGR